MNSSVFAHALSTVRMKILISKDPVHLCPSTLNPTLLNKENEVSMVEGTPGQLGGDHDLVPLPSRCRRDMAVQYYMQLTHVSSFIFCHYGL